MNLKAVQALIRLALEEDAAAHDITSRAVIPTGTTIRAHIIAKAPGILAGGPIALWTFQAVDRTLRCSLNVREGARLTVGQTILTVEGRARSILAAERTALNFLGHLSGIATLTHAFVRRVQGSRAKIFDTRKTLPGLRALEKYAVRVGGGRNHRFDLREAILIKTNHLRAIVHSPQSIVHSRTIPDVIRNAQQRAHGKYVEIEVTNLREFRAALKGQPDIILLDNWRLTDIRKTITLRDSKLETRNSKLLLEVSGGVTLKNVRAIAITGVDRISIGRLTHSAPSLDLSLRVV